VADEGISLRPTLHWNGTGLSVGFLSRRDDDAGIYLARMGCDCVDGDSDGFTSCDECDDEDAAIHPGASEVCNGVDDDCDGLVDEGFGLTSCGVGACGRTISNCFFGLTQTCSASAPTAEIWNGIDDNCDGMVDNTPSRSIVLHFANRTALDWEHDAGFDSYRVYRGSLSVLKTQGQYTQDPGSTALASRECSVPTASLADLATPPDSEAFFYLVTGLQGGVEVDLGINSAGQVRPNANPCP
jgi:hypothetical protein